MGKGRALDGVPVGSTQETLLTVPHVLTQFCDQGLNSRP